MPLLQMQQRETCFGETLSRAAHQRASRTAKDRQRWTLVNVSEAGNASYPRRYRSALVTGHEWADMESVDGEIDVKSADLQVVVRSELELQIFPVICRVSLPTKSLRNWRVQRLSAVPEALMTVRAATDKMKGKSEGKGEPAISFSGKGKGKWRKPNSAKQLQDKFAARKSKSTRHECGQRGHLTTWSDEQMLPDREDCRAIMMVERVEQFDVFLSCSGLLEDSVRTLSVTNLQQCLVYEHAPIMDNDHFNHVPVVSGTVAPSFPAESRETGRSVMESSVCSESRSDLGMGIIDTACLFCVAGSNWLANYKNLLVDVGLRHEIDDTREAERDKFGDGGALVSSIRVAALVVVAGQRGSFETLALLVGRDF